MIFHRFLLTFTRGYQIPLCWPKTRMSNPGLKSHGFTMCDHLFCTKKDRHVIYHNAGVFTVCIYFLARYTWICGRNPLCFFLKVIKPSISPVDSPLGKSSSQQIHVLHHPLLPSIHIPPPTLEPLGPQWQWCPKEQRGAVVKPIAKLVDSCWLVFEQLTVDEQAESLSWAKCLINEFECLLFMRAKNNRLS